MTTKHALWVAAALTACAGPRVERAPPAAAAAPKPVEAPRAEPRECETLLKDGDEKFDTGDWPGAVEVYRRARTRCPDVRLATLKLARGLNAIDDRDAAAELLGELVTSPEPPIEAFTELVQLREKLSPAARGRVAALGAAADRPVYVPAIRFEYSWLGTFACPDGHAQVSAQHLLSGPRGQLDQLDFSCGDGVTRTAFFDFSSDPMEKSLRHELGGGP
jgi:hypothetical protein